MASRNFTSMLSEARKFRLGLVLANQYAEQLQLRGRAGGGSVLDAVLGNVGSMVCCRHGINDAHTMMGQFRPEFGSHDLTSLPLGMCYVNMKCGRDKPASFSLEGHHLPRREDRQDHAQHMRFMANARHAIPRDQALAMVARHDKTIDDLPPGEARQKFVPFLFH